MFGLAQYKFIGIGIAVIVIGLYIGYLKVSNVHKDNVIEKQKIEIVEWQKSNQTLLDLVKKSNNAIDIAHKSMLNAQEAAQKLLKQVQAANTINDKNKLALQAKIKDVPDDCEVAIENSKRLLH